MKEKIIVAVTGASGSIYAQCLFNKLKEKRDQFEEIAVVFSNNAKQVWEYELDNTEYEDYPFYFYENKDYFSPIASGSSNYNTMFIIPCSMGTLGRIAHGISDNLITRAADVMLKERRKLILVARDTPFSLIHIKNMETITLAGGIICPANPSFYSRPQTMEELASTVVDRTLDLAHIPQDTYRWGESEQR